MSWSYVNGGTAVQVGLTGGDVVLPEPTGAQAGDLLVAAIVLGDGAQVTAPAGWAAITATAAVFGIVNDARLQWFWIKRGASAPSGSFTRTGGTAALGRMMAWRPSAGDFALDASAIATDTDGGTTAKTPGAGVTTSAAALLINAVVLGTSGYAANVTCTDPATGAATGVANPGDPIPTNHFQGRYGESNNFGNQQIISIGVSEVYKSSTGATGNLNVTTNSNAAAVFGLAAFKEVTPPPAGINVTNQPLNLQVYEGRSGSRSVTIAGTHTGATDTIQVQIETDAGAVVVPWQTLQASVAAGAFSGSVTVPRGGWYLARVRKASDTAQTALQTTLWGVGLIIGITGQSHVVGMSSTGTGPTNSKALRWTGSAFATIASNDGSGLTNAAATLAAQADCPVCFVLYGVPGASISSWWQSSARQANYTSFASQVTGAGGALSALVWWQGDADATDDARTVYYGTATEMFAAFRADYGATLPIVVVGLGRIGAASGSGSTDTGAEAMRDAHCHLGRDTNAFYVQAVDGAQLTDQQHFSATGYTTIGPRIGQALAHASGFASYSRGPAIASAVIAGSTLDVVLTHRGGTDIAPSLGITGFRVLDGSTPVTVTSAVRLSATAVRLTLASAPAGTVSVQYAYGTYPDVSSVLVDNTARALPLQSTESDVVATAAAAPSNTVLPAITGSPITGQVLSASTGTWLNSPTSFAYRWTRNGSTIAGATASTYAPQVSDVGMQLRVGVTATNLSGSVEALSAATAPVTEPAAPGSGTFDELTHQQAELLAYRVALLAQFTRPTLDGSGGPGRPVYVPNSLIDAQIVLLVASLTECGYIP